MTDQQPDIIIPNDSLEHNAGAPRPIHLLAQLSRMPMLGLTRIPLRLSGTWTERYQLQRTWSAEEGFTEHYRSTWRGTVQCTEEIVAMTLLGYNDRILWSKSSHRQQSFTLSLTILPYNTSVTALQIGFGVEGAGLWHHSQVNSQKYLPHLEDQQIIVTGEIVRFTCIEGNPPLELGMLFLARRDVRFGRKRLWHLRKEHYSGIAVPLARVLIDGRSGVIANGILG